MMKRFIDQVVMVTGASRGIGRATAERFASEGAKLALLSNDQEDLEQTAQAFSEHGYEALPLLVDVADEQQVGEKVEQAIRYFGKIDVLVNNAGIAWEEAFVDIKPENWRKILDVNLNGMFYVAQRVSQHMIEQGGGAIVNMAATNGLAGEEQYAHYNASKGGIVLLTKTMALELGRDNIRVNAVCPGYIVTPLSASIDSQEFVDAYVQNHIPLGRTGTMADVAGVFAFLASDDAAFITGETILVDGGQLAF